MPRSDNENDPEVKRLVRAVKVNDQMDLMQQLEIRVSCRFRLKKYVAIWRRFINFIQKKNDVRRGAVMVEEMNLAEVCILQSVQKRFFTEEVRVLSAKSEESNEARTLKKYNQIIKLDPFMDNSGLICVGGRLRRSVLDEDQKHPDTQSSCQKQAGSLNSLIQNVYQVYVTIVG